MTEQTITSFFSAEPRDGRRILREAAKNAPSAIDSDTAALIVLHYEDVQKLLLSTKLAGVGLTFFDHMSITEGPLRDWYGSLMFTIEGKPHHRLRSLVGKAFSPRSVESLRPIAQTIIEESLESLRTTKEGDLTEILADVPMRIMCKLLGVPDSDVTSFVNWVDALGPIFGMMTPEQIELATSASVQLLEYTEQLCKVRESSPGDDLISALIAAEHNGDRLTRKETAAMVANLLVAGHDTTSSQIGCTLLTLLDEPDLFRQITQDESLIPAIVNESIRSEPGIGFAPRTVVESVEICGKEREAGSMVWLSTFTANRDPAIWENPDTFDPDRFASAEAPKLLTFGGGPHHCLGAWLARLTLEETVAAVASLSPMLIEKSEEIPWEMKLGANPIRLPVSLL